MKYDVNVRAIVNATVLDPDAVAEADGWEIYDHETLERDVEARPSRIELRCDQLVTVDADNDGEAIEAAKSLASAIVLEGFEIDDVTLWVDEGIDVTPASELVETASPSP